MPEPKLEIPVRQKNIATLDEIDPENKQKFDVFLNADYLKRGISVAITDAVTLAEPKLSGSGIDVRSLVEKKYQDEIRVLADFTAQELSRLLESLHLSDLASHLIITFDGNRSFNTSEENGFRNIEVPLSFTNLYLRNPSLDLMVQLAKSLAHECFHIYVDQRYPSTGERTVKANQSNGEKDYDQDRGEIGSELFALKYLRQRAEEFKAEGKDVVAEAFAKMAEELDLKLKKRLIKLAPESKRET